MNVVIISVGTAVVLALFAAVIGPFFVDWNAYRAAIETRAERLLGADVSFAGDLPVRLLPNPRLWLDDVTLGPADAPVMRADAVDLNVALTPLLTGDIRIISLDLTAPDATLRLSDTGLSAGLQTARLDPARVAVEALAASDATLRLVDDRTGHTVTLEDAAVDGSARSLTGPFSLTARGTMAGRSLTARLSGGARDAAGALAISARAARDGAFEATFDGTLSTADGPRVSGNLDVADATRPLSLSGSVSAGPDLVALTAGTLRYGEEPADLSILARGSWRPATDDPITVSLDARQMDLDALLARLIPGPEAGDIPAGEALDALAQHLAPLAPLAATPPFDVLAEVNVGQVLLGGAVLRDLSAAVRQEGGAALLDRLELLLPGESAVEASGTLDEGFIGDLIATVSEPATLARWWRGTSGGDPLADADAIRLDGEVVLADGLYGAPRMSIRMGGTSADGRILWRRPEGSERPQVELSFAAPVLDAADISTVAGLVAGAPAALGEADVILDVAVDRIRFGDVEGDAVTLDASYRNGALALDALVAQDLAGAAVVAEGSIADLFGTPVGAIRGSLSLTDGERFGGALTALLPDTPGVARLSPVLGRSAPGEVSFSVSGGGDGDGLRATVTGQLGATTLDLAGARDGGGLSLTASARGERTADVLAQLGIPLPADAPEAFTTPASLTASLSGADLSALSGEVAVEALGAALSFDGEADLSAGLRLTGPLTLRADQMAPFATLLGGPLQLDGPVELAMRLGGEGGAVSMDDLSGTVDGVPIGGNVSFDGSTLSGALTVGEARLSRLAALVLGPVQWQDETGWSQGAFSDPSAPFLPALDVSMAADTLFVGERALTDAAFDVALDGSTMALRNLSASTAGGRMGADVEVTREGAGASLNGSLTLSEMALAPLTGGDGLATLSVEAASRGFSPADWVAALSGTGTLALSDASIPGLPDAPFDGLDALVLTQSEPSEETVRQAVVAHIEDSAAQVATAEAPLTIAGGIARMGAVEADGAPPLTSAMFNLADWTLSSTFALPIAADAPSVSLRFEGSPTEPTRTIDVADFLAWLTLRRLEDQVRAVEAQNEALAEEADEQGAPPLSAPAGDPDAPGEGSPLPSISEEPPVPRPAVPRPRDSALPQPSFDG